MRGTVVLKYRFAGGPLTALRVPRDIRHEKAQGLYAAGAVSVTIRGHLVKSRSVCSELKEDAR